MKRFIGILPIALLLATSTFALGQSAGNEVRVAIPDFIGLRIVGPGTGPRSVAFDYGTDPDAYFAAASTGTTLQPTAVNRFEDVQVNSTRNGRWRVQVVATAFAYTGPTGAAGLALADVRVERSRAPDPIFAGPGNSAGYATSWSLSTTPTEIAHSRGSTSGWRSLGISGWDYRLHVDGDEAPGTYRTVVTYFLTAP